MLPVRLLPSRYRWSRLDRSPNSDGISPVRLLPARRGKSSWSRASAKNTAVSGAVPGVLSRTKQHAPGSPFMEAAKRRAKNQGIRSSGEPFTEPSRNVIEDRKAGAQFANQFLTVMVAQVFSLRSCFGRLRRSGVPTKHDGPLPIGEATSVRPASPGCEFPEPCPPIHTFGLPTLWAVAGSVRPVSGLRPCALALGRRRLRLRGGFRR